MKNNKLIKNTIYYVLSGSHSYGLNTPSSDEDWRGICIPPKEYFISPFKNFNQWEDKQNDTVIYSIDKFIKLAKDANPNIIELLYIDEKFVKTIKPEGKLLRDNRDLFLSAKCKWTFSGYAHAQMKRIRNHRKWIENPVAKPDPISKSGQDKILSKNYIAKYIDGFKAYVGKEANNELLKLFEERDRFPNNIDKDWFHAKVQNIIGKIPMDYYRDFSKQIIRTVANRYIKEEHIDQLQKELEYFLAKKEWDSYNRWKKNRNPDRAKLEKEYGYDLKHASHLFRLLCMGKEILTKGTLTVNVGDNPDIWAIKKGKWSYEKLLSKAEELENEINETYKKGKYVVPKKPNMKKIEKLYYKVLNI